MEKTLRDVRIAVRWFRSHPGFTAVATLTLGLCIGASTILFSIVNVALLRPPEHVSEPDRLVQIYTSDYSGPAFGGSSYADFLDFRTQTPALADAAAVRPGTMVLAPPAGDASSEQDTVLLHEFVSGNYFEMLGVPIERGRGFTAEEDRPGSGAMAAVISHGLWQRQFGLDEDVVGRTARLNGRGVTIVGVAPEGFQGSLPLVNSDLWLPPATWAVFEPDAFEERGNRGLLVRGRLAPGATREELQSQLTTLAGNLFAEYPRTWQDLQGGARRVTVLSERESRLPPQVGGAALGFVGLLFGILALVLVLTCANIANLLLARSASIQREVAVRLSLGASRRRLLRQFLTESLVLAALGGLLGVALGFFGLRVLASVALPLPVDVRFDLAPDYRVLLFVLTLTAATGLLFGLVPALRSTRPELAPVLKSGGDADRGLLGSGRRFGLRNLVVVAQVAGSVVLLMGAGFFLRALQAASRVDLGFDAEGVVMLPMDLGRQAYSEEQSKFFQAQLLERLAASPDVAEAAWTDVVPLASGGGAQRRSIGVEGYEPAEGEEMEFDYASVTPGYFRTLGVRLADGRAFDQRDRDGAAPVAMVNQAFALRFWPGERAIGKRVTVRDLSLEVIGVTVDNKIRRLTEEPRVAFFLPALQFHSQRAKLVVRSEAGNAEALLPLVRGEVAALDPRLPITGLTTVEDAIGASLMPQTIASWLLMVTGALALALASMGLYGVLAYTVSRRVREIGIRMALGAQRRDVVSLVVSRGLALAVAGLLVGGLAAAGLGQLLRGMLFGADPIDPILFATTAGLLLLVAGAACYLPARRAARIQPATTLRAD